VVLSHHRRKDQPDARPRSVRDYFNSTRGSNALVAAADAALGLAREPDQDLGVLHVLLRDGPAERLHFTFDRASLTTEPTEAPRPAGEKASADDVLEVVRVHGGWVDRNYVAARLGVSTNTAKARLEVLVADERLQRRRGENNRAEYALPTGAVQPEVPL
jgi:hypothetical protein